MYTRVSADIAERLAAVVGRDHVYTDRERMTPYTHDETPGLAAWPEIVVRPGCTEEVAAIVRLAAAERVPITPRGAGQGLSG
ncbi:MAG: FAD-binding oxidoreductase, partial [Chloroflexi bacterium]|nr:FAD-binding oxidoreductase [Chloroflexota bacterium]